MDISEYTSFFHDGSIIDIQQDKNEILISMESAEISNVDLQNKLTLTEQNTLKGVLHIYKPINVSIDNELLNNNLKMIADVAGILNFDLNKNKIRFFIEWINYPPKKQIEKYSDLQIESDKIYWENNPNIFDPFGKNIDMEV